MRSEDFIQMPIPIGQYAAVCALLGGVSSAAVARGSAAAIAQANEIEGVKSKDPEAVKTGDQPAAAASATANADGVTHDKAGTPFDPARHTGSIVKSGLWRLKAGLSRLPGEDLPDDGTGTASSGSAANAGSTAGSPAASPATTGAADDEDEFAAFTKAAGGTSAAAARTWSDTDLSKLANQAATKLGGERVGEIKELIGTFVNAGDTPHSRNIPADKREAFAAALEAKAGITFDPA